WLDAVVGSQREVQFLFQIAVEVAEQQAEAAVRVWKPAFECAGDTLSRIVSRLEGQTLRRQQRPSQTSDCDPSKSGRGAPGHSLTVVALIGAARVSKWLHGSTESRGLGTGLH